MIYETDDEVELGADSHHLHVVVEKALDTENELAFSVVPTGSGVSMRLGITAYLGPLERRRLARLLVDLDPNLNLQEKCVCGDNPGGDGHWFGGPGCG